MPRRSNAAGSCRGLLESHAMTDSSSAFLAGRTAIVTGGSRGIGLATAMALRAEGADVLVCGRSGPALDGARARVEQAPGAGRVAAVVADVRHHDEAERLVAAAVKRFGAVDILINNAGVGRFAPVCDLAVDAWVETIRDEPVRRVLLLPRRDSGDETPRRGLDHQRQQSRRQASLCRRDRVLRVESGSERADRVADAGRPPRRHPGELRAAGLGEYRVRRQPAVPGRGLEARGVGRGPGRLSICCATRPAACPAGSSCARPPPGSRKAPPAATLPAGCRRRPDRRSKPRARCGPPATGHLPSAPHARPGDR